MLPCLILEDAHLLVVNKPAGLNTHAPSPHAGEGLYDWLRHRELRRVPGVQRERHGRVRGGEERRRSGLVHWREHLRRDSGPEDGAARRDRADGRCYLVASGRL